MNPKELTKSNFGPKGWWVTIYAFLAWTLSPVLNEAMNILYGYYGGLYGWTRTSMAAFVSAGTWFSILGIAVCGIFAKRWGAKKMLILGWVIEILGVALMVVAKTLGIWGVSRLIVTLGNGIVTGFGIQLLGSNWFPRKKGLFMGWATMGVIISSAFTNSILDKLMNAGVSVSNFMIGLIALYVVVIIITVLFIHNYPEDVGAYPDNDQSFSREEQAKILAMGEEYKKTSPWTVKNILKDKNTWFIVLGWGFLNMVMGGIFTQVVPAFASFGHGPQMGIKALAYSWPIALILSYIGGLWDAKWGTKHASRWLVCGMNVLGGVILGFFGHNLILAWIGMWLFMGANSAGNNMTMSIVSSRYGRYDFANGWAVISVLTRVLSGAGAVLTSAAADIFGGYKGAFLLLAGLAVVAFIFMSFASDKCVGRTEEEIEALVREKKAE